MMYNIIWFMDMWSDNGDMNCIFISLFFIIFLLFCIVWFSVIFFIWMYEDNLFFVFFGLIGVELW